MCFPVLDAIFERIYGKNPCKSPTDMGVNRIGFGIVDDEVVQEASRQEIIRRYYKALVGVADGTRREEELNKLELLMQKENLSVTDRHPVPPARSRAAATGAAAAAIELPDGRIVTGKAGTLLGSSAAVLMNAIKDLAGIPHHQLILSPESIAPIQNLKTQYLGSKNPRLHTDEVLIALSATAATNEDAALALAQLPKLRGCQVHSTVMMPEVDQKTFKKLMCDVTCDAKTE